MKLSELDKKMRQFETSSDLCILPEIYMIARIDGRNFTRLTKETHKFKAPYDERFRDMMIETVKHLMNCGFKVIYAFTESDEISLLFDLQEDSFSRKIRKFNSVLAGEASAKFSLLLQDLAVFDCRICQLPTKELVVDYFRWRNEDAHRNALNSHSYWSLRNKGLSPNEAQNQISGISNSDKNELLFQNGINFNEIPAWEKRGIGFYWEEYEKTGENPKTGKPVTTTRKRIKVDMNLKMKDEYSKFVESFL